MSCQERADVRRRTIANLAATDWGAPPVLVLDLERFDDRKERGSDTARRLLESAVERECDLALFLEDDVDFHPMLRRCLDEWMPLRARSAGDHFFASLYNPNVDPLAGAQEGPTYFVADPEKSYGSQAYVIARPTMQHLLAHWDDIPRGYDIKMTRLAAQVTPLYYHRPSLVEHLAVRSLIGGVPHESIDFDPQWRPASR